jgi:predicted lipoprotein with Yx(FWY)xxD motif
MKKLFTFGAVVAITAVLAACGGSSGSESATAASSEGGGGSTVSVAEIEGAGNVLVDSSGQALYASEQETASGKVMCTGACTSFWKPLTVSGGTPSGSVPGQLGVMKRPEGSMQVTFDGKLLYTFTQEGPEEVTGDGFQDAFEGEHFTWHVVSTGGGGAQSGESSESNEAASSESGGSYSY